MADPDRHTDVGGKNFEEMVRNTAPGSGRANEQDQINRLTADAAPTDRESTMEDRASKAEKNQINKLGKGSSGSESEESTPSGFSRLRRIRITGKQAAAGGGIGLGIGGILWGLAIVQGPLQFMHMSQLFQGFHLTGTQEFEGRRNIVIVRNLVRGTPHRSRLGTFGNKYADRIELRMNDRAGLRSVYDRRTGKFVGYEVLDENKAREYIDQFGSDGVPIDDSIPGDYVGPDVDGKVPDIDRSHRLINVSGLGRVERKGTIKTILKSQRIQHVPGGPSSRMLVTRAGVDFHPIKAMKRKSGESVLKFWDRVKKKHSEYRKRGLVTDIKKLDGQDNDADDDGEPDREDTKDSADKGNDLVDEMKGADNPAKKNGLVAKLLKGGSVITAFATALCIVNDASDEIDIYQYEKIILPLIRMGSELISIGDQIRAGGLAGLKNSDLTMDEVSALASDLNATDKDTGKKTNWSCAASIQSELGKEPTCPDIDDEARPSRVGKKNFLFEFTDKLGGFLDTACGISDSVISSIPIVKDIANMASSVVEGAINTALSTFDTSIGELYEAVVSFFAGEVVDTFAQGPDWGNQGNYGGFLANKEYVTGLGGVPLTESENTDITMDADEALALKQKDKSFIARIFDVTDANSMAAIAMRDRPQSITQSLAAMFSAPFKFIGGFIPSVSAADNNHDYDMENSGFTLEEQADPRVQDPFANAEIVEDKLEDLNEEYDECFGTKIIKIDEDKLGVVLADFQNEDDKKEAAARYREMPDKCRTDKNNDHIEDNEDLLRYRFFIADTIQTFAIACSEGNDDACEMLTYGVKEEEGGGELPTGPTGADGCPTSPVKEEQVVRVTGGSVSITVHPCIQSIVQKLLDKAAADGINLSGSSGWRDGQRQIELRIAHCGSSHYDIYEKQSGQCSPPTARPGSSNHEAGTAIDFECGGSNFTKGSSCYQWLAGNNGLGLINLPSESWHWSNDGH